MSSPSINEHQPPLAHHKAQSISESAKLSSHASKDLETILRRLEQGTTLNRLCRKSNKRRFFRIRLDTRQLVWSSEPQSRIVGSLDLREIKEVRVGLKQKWLDILLQEGTLSQPEANRTLNRSTDGLSLSDSNGRNIVKKLKKYELRSQCFVVYYGTGFNLNTLTCAASSPNECEQWVRGLLFLVEDSLNAPYEQQMDIWLRKELCRLPAINIDEIKMKDLKAFLYRNSYKLTSQELTQLVDELDIYGSGTLSWNQSCHIFYERILFDERVPKFLYEHMNEHSPRTNLVEPNLTDHEFVSFLFSKANELWNRSKHSVVCQDMTRPLTHYWIASSHNTYLTGDQIRSVSSVECYARALRMGSRCIEIDCWDGPEGRPVIYHGHTLTSKISFLEVIKTINEHAFVTSNCPVILSVENHCSLPQQRYMASVFSEVFGDALVTAPLDPNGKEMPSPTELKHRIIIKHRKLPDSNVQQGDPASLTALSPSLPTPELITNESIIDLDLRNCSKKGILYLETRSNEWKPYFFVLSNDHNSLYYFAVDNEFNGIQDKSQDNSLTVDDDESDEEQQLLTNNSIDNRDADDQFTGLFNQTLETPSLADLANTELTMDEHLDEPWFHGRITLNDIDGRPSGREETERRINAWPNKMDGSFLVRESDTYIGDYSLSFWKDNKVNHARIRQKRLPNGRVHYYLIESNPFPALYNLITYYTINQMKARNELSVCLTDPVYPTVCYKNKDWFCDGELSREGADYLLKRVQFDGAFLVRRKSVVEGSCLEGVQYSISFRAKGKILHCRIRKEGRLYFIFSQSRQRFVNLNELVEYYQKIPLYQEVCLKKGINCIDNVGSEDPCETESSYLYHSLITGTGSCDSVEVPQKGCVNLCGANVTMFNRVKQVAMSHQQQTQHNSIGNYAIQIMFPTSGPVNASLTISGLDQELRDWFSRLQESCSIRTNSSSTSKSSSSNSNDIDANFKIAQELSNLIVYCRAVPFAPEKVGVNFTEMSSFPETKVDKWLHANHCSFLLNYNSHQFSRVYPKGARLDSSNYDPIKMWNVGIQMAALNYQTGDRAMQLNQAKFSLQNGACGYVLKPECMFEESFNPYTTVDSIRQRSLNPWMLSVRVICARHLTKSKGRGGVISPFVEVEIAGAEFDNNKFKTATIDDNGLTPYWNEQFTFKVHCPELAFLRFAVYDEDVFGEPQFVGQATYPLTTIRQGFRKVRLQNEYSEVLEMAAILVQVTIQSSISDD